MIDKLVRYQTKARQTCKSLIKVGCVAQLALLGGLDAVQAQTLKYSDHDPLGGLRTEFVKNVWFDEINKQSAGKVEIQEFWGGALLGSKEILNGLSAGITNMGFVYPGHYPRRLVAHSIFSLFPRGPEKFENMSWLYRTVYDEVPEFKQELDRAGVKLMMLTAGLPGAFTSTKPLAKLDDLSGNKWRAGGKWPLQYLANAGATPVSVPWGDVYIAMQTGTIDGTFTNYDGLHLMKFDEVGTNLLISKELWFATPFLHLMSKSTYDGLSKEQQDMLQKASLAAEAKFGQFYDAEFDKIRKEQEAAGYSVTTMSSEDVLKWEGADKLSALQQQWVDSAKEAGLENAEDVMRKVRDIHARAMAR